MSVVAYSIGKAKRSNIRNFNSFSWCSL